MAPRLSWKACKMFGRKQARPSGSLKLPAYQAEIHWTGAEFRPPRQYGQQYDTGKWRRVLGWDMDG